MLADERRRLALTHVSGYPVSQVYAPEESQFICFEPMTAPVDALISGEDLSWVQARRGATRLVFTICGRETLNGRSLTMETWDAITSRRNVREFTDEPLPDDALQRILEAGWRAPSSRNWQPWDFVVVTDRAQLRGALAGLAGRRSHCPCGRRRRVRDR